MRILPFLACLDYIPMGPAGLLLVRHAADPEEPRVIGGEADLAAALRSPSGQAAIFEALGTERRWDAGAVVAAQQLRGLIAPGSVPWTDALPWALFPPASLRALRQEDAGTPVPGPEIEGSPRHRLNLAMIRTRRVLDGERVLQRVALNVLDAVGLQIV